MGLVGRKESSITTTGGNRLPICHTCLERKSGVFTVDRNGRPQCGDCAEKNGRPTFSRTEGA